MAKASKDILEAVGLKRFGESIRPEYRKQFTREDAIAQGLALAIASAIDWDIVQIMKLAAWALEDANAHEEAGYLFKRIKKYEGR